ncbi:hypothetical protein [Paenibacillus alginolyticus]|uniref:HEAT repeat domain-containing protein n=1 Tax=Paenibacillus alginolyticus TaxID=59839 RepID=A0ABT4GDX8_9BACL|nr:MULTISPECIES: hypothetical protein [Paenibacillus]MCY9694314.1 hypothetical protein [Paenibacillus alginolyticus]MEC0142864.1 hypothetical protein [Paenibacillus alginolyticus]NRF91470.1 hypothetical protein [Paenibacillus frigoriresistens]
MIIITDPSINNLILFPKTEQYYEEELTRFLQTEQYSDALQLLTFLLQFPTVDPHKAEQWEALRNWLYTMYPESMFAMTPMEEDPEEESDLLRQYIQEKTTDDGTFALKLLNMLNDGTLEQQVNALEQLAFIDQSGVSERVKEWLCEKPRHPHIQFKALQALKQMGERGFIEFPKNGEKILVEIEETPLCPEDFPSRIRDMIRRVGDISEISQPDFVYFAKQTWQEFLAYAYGTSIYTDLQKAEEGAVDVWASALHAILQEKLFGAVNREELLDNYGIVDSMKLQWKRANLVLQTFVKQFNPDPS